MRLTALDGLRGLAAVSVVAFHYLHQYHAIYGHAFEPWGWLQYLRHGVEVFFVISGFVIFMTLERCQQPLDFVVSRMARLYPAYWACCLLTFSAVALFGLSGRESSLGDLLVNLTMTQGHLGIRPIDGVYWTLTVELSFYGLMFALLLTKQLKNIWYYLVAWMALIPFQSHLNVEVQKILILSWAPYFALGIALHKLNAGRYIARLRWLSSPPLVWLGGISYSLYLIHQNIGYIIINALGTAGILVALLASLGLAHLVRELIEKPGGKRLRRSIEQLTNRQPAPPVKPGEQA